VKVTRRNEDLSPGMRRSGLRLFRSLRPISAFLHEFVHFGPIIDFYPDRKCATIKMNAETMTMKTTKRLPKLTFFCGTILSESGL